MAKVDIAQHRLAVEGHADLGQPHQRVVHQASLLVPAGAAARKFSDAVKFDNSITYDETLARHLGVMDATAFALVRDNNVPIIVCRMFGGDICRAVNGEAVGISFRTRAPKENTDGYRQHPSGRRRAGKSRCRTGT